MPLSLLGRLDGPIIIVDRRALGHVEASHRNGEISAIGATTEYADSQEYVLT
jgi:hypothetical protein